MHRHVDELPDPERTRALDAIRTGYLPALPGDFTHEDDTEPFRVPARDMFRALTRDGYRILGRWPDGVDEWSADPDGWDVWRG